MPEKTSFLLVLALWGAGLGAAAQYGKMSVIFDLLPQLYPNGGAALGLVVSLVGFVGIILGVVAGLIVARIRFRPALIWALWLGAAVSIFQAFLPPLPLMLASRIFEGASHLAIVVAAPTLIAQLSAPGHRGVTLTLWGTFFGVAFAVLAFAGRPLAETMGVSALFLAHAIYMATFALLLTWRLRALSDDDPQPPFSFAQMLADHGTIYRSPRIAAAAAGWLFYTFSFVSILTVLPPFLAAEDRAWVMTTMPLASIAVSMTAGIILLRWLSGVQVVLIGFALSFVAMLWLWAAPGLPLAAITLAGCMGLIQGASFAAVPQLNDQPQTQAQANGAMAQMGNIGNTIGTPIMALALSTLGDCALPLLGGTAFALGMAVHLWLAHRRRKVDVLL